MSQALVLPFNGIWPEIADDVFLAPGAVVLGNVRIESEASVWFGAVLRGDDPDHSIVVGARSNIQDGCVAHVGSWCATIVGPDCTIGHGAKFESCRIGERCTIGMNAVILQEAEIGAGSLVAAGAVVLERAVIPPESLAAGVPARVRKKLDGSAACWVERGSEHYVKLSRCYLEQGVGRVSDARRNAAHGA